MEDKLLKIINHYGTIPQLRQLNEECYEFIESVRNFNQDGNPYNFDHAEEEFADIMVMLEQFKLYYGFTDETIKEIMQQKIDRQIRRIMEEK